MGIEAARYRGEYWGLSPRSGKPWGEPALEPFPLLKWGVPYRYAHSANERIGHPGRNEPGTAFRYRSSLRRCTMASSIRFLREVRSPNWLVWAIAATTLLSCSDSEPTEPIDDVPLPAVAISINPNASTLLVGEVAYLSAIPVTA